MRVVLGGTFDPLHKGHKALFETAFQMCNGELIIVGLTSDNMAQKDRVRKVRTFSERKAGLETFFFEVAKKLSFKDVQIIEIDEVFNKPITQEIDADVLIVSEGTKKVAEKTNEHRVQHGKEPLKIVAVPYILAEDGLPIKATRIHDGEIDIDGRLRGPVKVAIGTKNEVKVQAVGNIYNKIYEDLVIETVKVSTGVPEQPWGEETIVGAKNRAQNAIANVSDAHFGVGVEAGLFWNENTKNYYDVQYCAIVDRGGRITYGHGSGFYYPARVVEGLKHGRTVGEVMSEVTGIDHIGHKQGAIGYLSKGLLSREQLTEQAVLMAMVPRLTGLY